MTMQGYKWSSALSMPCPHCAKRCLVEHVPYVPYVSYVVERALRCLVLLDLANIAKLANLAPREWRDLT